MLTLKLCNTRTGQMTVVEATDVSVVAAARSGTKRLRTGRAYDVGANEPYDVAYVENAAGHTVQIIKGEG